MSNEKKRALALDSRPLCKYGKECYRKNPGHFEEFRHPAYDSGKKTDNYCSKLFNLKVLLCVLYKMFKQIQFLLNPADMRYYF